ncbi:MAG: dTDP-4-dehydrorhamnose 3,5-epimerase [Saprospiraceae bacterium]|nr:dTDP-4-dehydrorhamnose 3,5-epimerase [Lewinella sp.]
MKFIPTKLADACLVELEAFSDDRGWFARAFCKKEFEQIGHRKEWVQINHSMSREKGTIRGMHFQYPPHNEAKLVRCIAGKVFDVALDIRRGSPTFLQWVGFELSAANRRMLYIPEGFAHGFQTLTDDVELIYHHSAYYTPDAEGGLRFDDPALGIEWPLPAGNISVKDQNRAFLTDAFQGIEVPADQEVMK